MSYEIYDTYRKLVPTSTGDISCIDYGEGAPALFLHGVGTNAYLWYKLIAQLPPAGRRFVALDLPLHGRSPARADQDFSLTGLADAVPRSATRSASDRSTSSPTIRAARCADLRGARS